MRRDQMPTWITLDAHTRLKEYCDATNRTQKEVVSKLILEHLIEPQEQEVVTEQQEPMGGVWVI